LGCAWFDIRREMVYLYSGNRIVNLFARCPRAKAWAERGKSGARPALSRNCKRAHSRARIPAVRRSGRLRGKEVGRLCIADKPSSELDEGLRFLALWS